MKPKGSLPSQAINTLRGESMKHKCECSDASYVPEDQIHLYDPEEYSGMNHDPGKCKGTNNVRLYDRDGKKLWLCSCCCCCGDKEL